MEKPLMIFMGLAVLGLLILIGWPVFATWNKRYPALLLVAFIGVLSVVLLFLKVMKAL